MITPPRFKLGISREGFLYRATTLLNKMGDNVRNEANLENFKLEAKNWVKNNIHIKPIPRRMLGEQLPRTRNRTEDNPRQNTIDNYFHPLPNTQNQNNRPATRQTFLEQYFRTLNPLDD